MFIRERIAIVGVAAILGGCTLGTVDGPAQNMPNAFEQQVITLAAQRCEFQPTPGTVRKVAAGLGEGGRDAAAVAARVCAEA